MARSGMDLLFVVNKVLEHWAWHPDWSLEHLIQMSHCGACCSYIDDGAMLEAMGIMDRLEPYASGERDRYHATWPGYQASEHDYRKFAARETRDTEYEMEGRLHVDHEENNWNG